ncbi:MAG: hypothetical protein M1457_10300, partial [bacterium]|nr:hypothetical protein [bacterium]
ALREGYRGRVATRFGLRLETLEAVLRQRARRPAPAGAGAEGRPGAGEEKAGGESIVAPSLSEQNLLYILLKIRDPWDLMRDIEPAWFQDDVIRRIYERLYEAHRDVREGADPPEDLFSLFEDPLEREWISKILLLPTRLFGGEVEDFDQQLADGLRLQTFKLRRQWHERRKRELTQDLQTIMGENPIGQGHLAAIDALSRESVRHHSLLIEPDEKRNGQIG